MINVDTKVDYVKDNLRIIGLHTRLTLGMLLRFPVLALRLRRA